MWLPPASMLSTWFRSCFPTAGSIIIRQSVVRRVLSWMTCDLKKSKLSWQQLQTSSLWLHCFSRAVIITSGFKPVEDVWVTPDEEEDQSLAWSDSKWTELETLNCLNGLLAWVVFVGGRVERIRVTKLAGLWPQSKASETLSLCVCINGCLGQKLLWRMMKSQ